MENGEEDERTQLAGSPSRRWSQKSWQFRIFSPIEKVTQPTRTKKPPSWEAHKVEEFTYLGHICQTEVKGRREVRKGQSRFQVFLALLKSAAEQAAITCILHRFNLEYETRQVQSSWDARTKVFYFTLISLRDPSPEITAQKAHGKTHVLDYRFKLDVSDTVIHMLKVKINVCRASGISLIYKSENYMLYKQKQTGETCSWALVLFRGDLRLKNLKMEYPYQYSI